ncbi:hypothetical protein [Enterovibrio norvegicus]|uniref:Uncharacterized protein n=1 Tax=Enterovibrio norvegicus TaxID=188144 RepID=A0A2N7LCX8_9GAMM|nr:hypothetical protein [Enterovibrio norvegicus]PMN93190.1 hypothetical protein BCT23_13875 [Enterovibrio norvegicus]
MKKYLESTATESLIRILAPVSGVIVAFYLVMLGSEVLALISLVVSILVFWKSKRNLLLKDTRYPSNEINYKNCKKAAVIHGWGTVSDIEMARLEFETAASLGSWGELITILFTSTGIYINSRPSPTKRPSIVTLGKNKLNEQKVVDMLEGRSFTSET